MIKENFVNQGSDQELVKSLYEQYLDEEKEIPEELEKALDKTKLVQVQRQVNGKHGVFTRMQWVSPSDVKSTDIVVGGKKSTEEKKPASSVKVSSFTDNDHQTFEAWGWDDGSDPVKCTIEGVTIFADSNGMGVALNSKIKSGEELEAEDVAGVEETFETQKDGKKALTNLVQEFKDTGKTGTKEFLSFLKNKGWGGISSLAKQLPEELEKALDKTKLVQVQRQVNGRHGVFTRMQWVKPSDVKSTDIVISKPKAEEKKPVTKPNKNLPSFDEITSTLEGLSAAEYTALVDKGEISKLSSITFNKNGVNKKILYSFGSELRPNGLSINDMEQALKTAGYQKYTSKTIHSGPKDSKNPKEVEGKFPRTSIYTVYSNSEGKILIHKEGSEHYAPGVTGYNTWDYWTVFDASVFGTSQANQVNMEGLERLTDGSLIYSGPDYSIVAGKEGVQVTLSAYDEDPMDLNTPMSDDAAAANKIHELNNRLSQAQGDYIEILDILKEEGFEGVDYILNDISDSEDYDEEYRDEELEDEETLRDIATDWETKLSSAGFEGVEVRYDVSHAQGDGASFTCDDVDILKLYDAFPGYFQNKHIDRNKAELAFENAHYSISPNTSRYVHERTVDTDCTIFNMDLSDEEFKVIDDVCEIIDEIQVATAKEIYRSLQNKEFPSSQDNDNIRTLTQDDYRNADYDTYDAYDFSDGAKPLIYEHSPEWTFVAGGDGITAVHHSDGREFEYIVDKSGTSYSSSDGRNDLSAIVEKVQGITSNSTIRDILLKELNFESVWED